MKSNLEAELKDWKYNTIGISMDGGTLCIECIDSKNQRVTIALIQHLMPEYTPEMDPTIPGRIYLKGELVDKRSTLEEAIIEFLEESVYKIMPTGKESLHSAIEFIKSDRYLSFIPIKKQLSENRRQYLKSINRLRSDKD